VLFVPDTDSVLFLDTCKNEKAFSLKMHFGNILFNLMILEIYKGDVSLRDGGRPKILLKYKMRDKMRFFTPTDPVPPEGDPSEDAPVSRGKLRTKLTNCRRSASSRLTLVARYPYG